MRMELYPCSSVPSVDKLVPGESMRIGQWIGSSEVLHCSEDSLCTIAQKSLHDIVRNSFISIYFSHFELFLPTNTHSPNTCFHSRYDLTTCSLLFISFHFHHSHQVQTFTNTAKSIRRSIKGQKLSHWGQGCLEPMITCWEHWELWLNGPPLTHQ